MDKLLHFVVCLILSFTLSYFLSWQAGVVVPLLLSILKEIIDQIRYNGWDRKDLIADIIGIILGTIIGVII